MPEKGMKEPVSKDMLIGDVVSKFPPSVKVMSDHGLHCIGCHVATWETLEQGCQGHGLDVDSLVKEINKAITLKP